MKTSQWITACALAGMITAGCATKEKLVGSSYAPAAQGRIKADKGSGGNTDIDLEVEHLAPPERIASGATDYIVWVQPEGSQSFQNIGVLKVDKDLEGEYETTIPYKKFRVMVTPEASSTGTQPTGPVVFDQYVSR